VEPITVVLIDLPRVLSDIVTAIVDPEDDLRLLGAFTGTSQPVGKAGRAPDVAIVGNDDRVGQEDREPPPRVSELFRACPRMKILTIGEDGRRGFLYELRPIGSELSDVSPATLLGAIRSARP